MSPTNVSTTEEIIEKKASAPVASACLILACVSLIGGIVFHVMEIAQYRSGAIPAVVRKGIGQDRAKKEGAEFQREVDELLKKSAAAVSGSATPDETPSLGAGGGLTPESPEEEATEGESDDPGSSSESSQ